MPTTVALAAGAARVTLLPQAGGSIAAFTWRGIEVLKSAAPAAVAAGDPLGMASYPLVPYSNRIAAARLAFDGGGHELRRNLGAHPHAIHGVGWQRPWRVRVHAAARAVLELDHAAVDADAADWPWPFRAEQEFVVESDGAQATLVATLAIENTGSRRFPCGLGWHPFFPCDASTLLAFASEGVWRTDDSGLPTECERPEPWGFATPRPLPATPLDNVFAGWSGRAVLQRAGDGLGVVLRAGEPCRHLVVYTPADRRSIALEPVTHVTDAFNRAARGDADTGMLVLEPGARIACTMRIDATTLP
jgi:aldose 1-epimerase